MWFFEFLFLVIGGALAIPNIVTEKVPNASEVLKRIEPYQPWFGLALLIWGILDFLTGIILSGRIVGAGILSGILLFIVILVEIFLGLILSMNFLKTIKELPAKEIKKFEVILVKYQTLLGIGGIIAGVYILLRYTILFFARF
ncbi:MAG: hypothetical protein ABSG94_03850 [Brevinematales bacterium]|jgi:hypothetical protein